MYWAQGWDAAPPLVQRAAESWRDANPGWSLNCLDADTWRDHLPDALGPPKWLSLAHQSDCLRYALLARLGGVWADATTICARPLDHWIDLVTQPAGFFAFAAPFPDRPLANWFLAASARAPLASGWHDASRNWIDRHGQTGSYLWSHYLFQRLTAGRGPLAQDWARVPKVSARASHTAQAILRAELPDTGIEAAMTAPVHKLSLRLPCSQHEVFTMFDRLLDDGQTHV